MRDQDRFDWDTFAIVTVVGTFALWSLVLFGGINWLIQVWLVVGGAIFIGALIFGTIGIWAICMDLYTFHKIRRMKQRGQE